MLIIVVLTPMMFLGLSGWHLLWAIPVCFITGSVLILWPPYFILIMLFMAFPFSQKSRELASTDEANTCRVRLVSSEAVIRQPKGRNEKLEVGDKVKVASGTKDPDFGKDISGWSGEITDVEEKANEGWLFCVLWDEATLSKMPRKLIRRIERANLDYLRMYIEEHELVFLSES